MANQLTKEEFLKLNRKAQAKLLTELNITFLPTDKEAVLYTKYEQYWATLSTTSVPITTEEAVEEVKEVVEEKKVEPVVIAKIKAQMPLCQVCSKQYQKDMYYSVLKNVPDYIDYVCEQCWRQLTVFKFR